MFFNDKETIIRLTPEWKGERLPDGRPKVSADVLRRMRNITFEEAWGPLWGLGYRNNWECNFKMTAGRNVLVGRAVTAVMVPKRPDLDAALMDIGKNEEGHKGFYNQWVIDNLVEDDVVVVDLYDKIFEGTYVGGNLSTAIRTRTKNGGAVIWGGVRDLQQIVEIEGLQIYYRGVDPTGIGNCSMTSYNGPCRIGQAICMPGDVVLGTMSGVIFIPPQHAEMVVERAEKNHVRDIFGFDRLKSKTYTTAQIDTAWTVPMWEDFVNWFETDPRAEEYRHLSWDKELEEAREKEKEKQDTSSQVRL
jgi:regulator of RNase E activity RraA